MGRKRNSSIQFPIQPIALTCSGRSSSFAVKLPTMKIHSKVILAALSLTVLASCAELTKLMKHAEDYGVSTETAKDVLTNDEIIRGLKDALGKGTDFAVSSLNVKDGYFGNQALKILLPKEAKPMYERLEKIPVIDGILDDAVESVNRAAENAAIEAKPIFMQAIKEMTITDGMGILRGSDTAATSYLRKKTYQQLYNAFKPKIQASLEKNYINNISAEGTYKKAIDTYNTASLKGVLWKQIQNNSLAEHTTNKALKGLFSKVALEEKEIRVDPVHRVTES